MKLSSLILSAAIATSALAVPAQAQRSVSGTIGAAHAAQETVTAASTPAAPAAAGTPIPSAAAGLSSVPPPAPAATAPATAPSAASAAAAPAAAAPAAGPAALGMGPAPSTSASAGLLQTTLALLFVLALLVGLAWLLRRFGPRNFGGGNNTVKLVGALSVGARERILVVEVGEQWIVVGASPGRMNALATMPRQEGPAAAGGATPPASANFAEWFKQTIEKRNGK